MLPQLKKKALKTLCYLLAYFPTRLPLGMPEYEKWADSILELTGEFADPDSLRFALASMVMQGQHKTDRVPKIFFARGLRKAAASQLAGQAFYDIKMKHKAKQQAEDTAAQKSDVSDGQLVS